MTDNKNKNYEYLIEEREVLNAKEFANEVFNEVNRILQSNNWKIEINKKNLLVESKPICGELSSSNILLSRAKSIVEGDANKIFKFLISSEGYAIIDPACNPKEHKKSVLETYPTEDNMRLDAALASTKLPFLGKIDFVVFNAVDYDNLTFASKSILHDKVKGGSKYSKNFIPNSTTTRGLNTFAIKLKPLENNKSEVEIINYIDLCSKVSAKFTNVINIKYFFKLLLHRLNKKIKKL